MGKININQKEDRFRHSTFTGILSACIVAIFGIVIWALVEYFFYYIVFVAGAAISIFAFLGYSLVCKNNKWKYLVCGIISVLYIAISIYVMLAVTYVSLENRSGRSAAFFDAFYFANTCITNPDTIGSISLTFFIGIIFAGIGMFIMFIRERNMNNESNEKI